MFRESLSNVSGNMSERSNRERAVGQIGGVNNYEDESARERKDMKVSQVIGEMEVIKSDKKQLEANNQEL